MEQKRKARLHHWYLEKTYRADGTERCRAHGIVTGHYRLEDTTFINTSSVESVEVNRETEEVTIVTRNTIYLCRLSECAFLEGDTAIYIPFLYEYEGKYNKEKEYEVEENTVLLVLSDHEEYYFEAVFAKENKILYKGTMYPHIGMFQDSCLIDIGEFAEEYAYKREIDIRYFPYYKHLEMYNMESAGLEIYIENAGEDKLSVTTFVGVIEVEAGERKRVCKENTVVR